MIDPLKIKFAEGLFANKPAFDVATEIFDSPGQALVMSKLWPEDPVVLTHLKELEEELGSNLVTKDEYAKAVYLEATTTRDPDIRHKFFKLFGDIQGYLTKPQTNITANVQNVSNRVMIVKENGSIEEWENKLRTQQDKLTLASAG